MVRKSDEGKVEMVTKTGATGAGAAMGGFWGLLFGLLFLVPVAGLVIGGLMGALMGTISGWGVKDEFRKRAADVLKPGGAALVVFVSKATPDKALAALAPLGGELLRTRSRRTRSRRSSTPWTPAARPKRPRRRRARARPNPRDDDAPAGPTRRGVRDSVVWKTVRPIETNQDPSRIPWESQTEDGQVLLSMPWEVFVLGVALLSITNLFLAILVPNPDTAQVIAIVDSLLFVVFLIDFVRRMVVARDNRAYLVRGYGWLDLISIFPMLRIARLLRVARLVRILRRMGGLRSPCGSSSATRPPAGSTSSSSWRCWSSSSAASWSCGRSGALRAPTS